MLWKRLLTHTRDCWSKKADFERPDFDERYLARLNYNALKSICFYVSRADILMMIIKVMMSTTSSKEVIIAGVDDDDDDDADDQYGVDVDAEYDDNGDDNDDDGFIHQLTNSHPRLVPVDTLVHKVTPLGSNNQVYKWSESTRLLETTAEAGIAISVSVFCCNDPIDHQIVHSGIGIYND